MLTYIVLVVLASLVVGLYLGQFPFIIYKLPPRSQTMTVLFFVFFLHFCHESESIYPGTDNPHYHITLPELSMLLWIHVLPNVEALNVPDERVLVFLLSGSGGFHRRIWNPFEDIRSRMDSMNLSTMCVLKRLLSTLSTKTLDPLRAQKI